MGWQGLRSIDRQWVWIGRSAMNRLGLSLLLSGFALVWLGQPSRANVPTARPHSDSISTPAIAKRNRSAIGSKKIAQVKASLVQITGVRVESTATGLQVIINTIDGSIAAPASRVEGKNLIIEIPSAQLNLADRATAKQSSPVAGIETIEVTALPNDRVQVTILGTTAPPVADIQTNGQNLVMSVSPGTKIADGTDSELEITVTGRRKQEGYNPTRTSITRTDTSLKDIPQAVQVIPQEVIKERQANTLVETLRAVPGVEATRAERSVDSQVNIRGGDANYRTNGQHTATFPGPLGSVERVEVLKGPASVLFGDGSFGGTINLVTKQPRSEPYYAVEGAVGSFGLYRGTVDFSGPLNADKTLLYRLNVLGETSDSFVDFLGRDLLEVAPVMTWKIGKNTDLKLEAKYVRNATPYDPGLPARGTVLDNLNGQIPLNRNAGTRNV